MIPDNYSQFEAHEAQLDRLRQRLPVCDECGEPIESEDCYEFDGNLICEDCLKSNHKKCTENYISIFD